MARTVDEAYDVVVIGGGASGLAAALASAGAGARAAVLERDVACGLPILATGNGRCNLSNANLDPARYRHADAVRTVMGEQPERALDTWFTSLGVLTRCEDGRLYPYSKRAESVRDALLAACAREGVELRCGHDVMRAAWQEATGSWRLDALAPAAPPRAIRGRDFKAELRARRKALGGAPKRSVILSARAIVLAPGGASAEACQIFSLPHLDEQPMLCPVACAPAAETRGAGANLLARLDGLRVECGVHLIRAGCEVWAETGEVLFRAYGLSGIVIFDMSRRVEPGDDVVLDLFPCLSEAELVRYLRDREQVVGALEPRARTWFDGVLAPEVGRAVLDASNGSVEGCARAAKRLVFRATGCTETRSAQVRRGGIPLDAVDLETLAVRAPHALNLFACGEALDQDADCGGYNLAWAWLSGQRAGAAAAHATQR